VEARKPYPRKRYVADLRIGSKTAAARGDDVGFVREPELCPSDEPSRK
jgi:hypothetical protein